MTGPRRARTCLVTLVLVAAWTAPPAASAQEDGAVIDPDSPSAKQFGNALEGLRLEAAAGRGGEEGSITPSQRPPPLFGVGVGRSSPSDHSRGGGASPGEDWRTRLVIAAVMTLVVALGLLAGLAVRRSSFAA